MHLSGVAGISPQDRPARDRILLTAHDLFYRDGVRATGIDRVIAEAGVTKVTFYRHFPSKNDLIRTFLAYRHEQWMAWFIEALGRHGAGRARKIEALVPALREWLDGDNYRGCAFLNSVSELGGVLPEVMEIARAHKMDMTTQIERLMPSSRQRSMNAQVIALAVDGAILRAQYDETPDGALKALRSSLKMMTQSPS
ncbi:MAG: TetR family transcriptional regulator [Variovorax sp.]|jgi:AcrR family transcriptional regulator|nr:TetR family transcriptional regulator [Variovorax sp.]